MDKTADGISAYAASLIAGNITPLAFHATKRVLIDSIGCAIGAFSAEPVKIAREVAYLVCSDMPASMLGTRKKTSLEMAAFVNGTMVRFLDFNDYYYVKDGGHPSDGIGAILAACEAVHADGKTMALAITLAYEVTGQLTASAELVNRGWDYSTKIPIGYALGVGKILGLTGEQMSHALSLSLVPNISLLQTRKGQLSMWKACAGPNAARNGVFAALLAWKGMTGPGQPIEGPSGLWDQVTGSFALGPFGGEGRPFRIEDTFFKERPVVYPALLPVETVLKMRNRISIEDIESIRLFMHQRAMGSKGSPEDPERWNPTNRETADHSVPYCVVAALIDGEITDNTFMTERFRDSRILALLKKVTVEEDPDYTREFSSGRVAQYNCRIEITGRSGTKVVEHGRNPKGHPGNPMSDREIGDKFLRLTEGVLGTRQAQAALDLFWHLEEIDDVSKIIEAVLVQPSGGE